MFRVSHLIMLLMLLVLMVSTMSTAYAQNTDVQAKGQGPANPNLVSYSVVNTKEGERLVEVKMKPSAIKMDEIDRLRQHMFDLEGQTNQANFDKQLNKTRSEVFTSTTLRLAPETLSFFLANGAVTFNTMWMRAAGDPLAMERQIMSLKDPISHLSFYAFMQANGFYVNFQTKRLRLGAMDPMSRSQMMRRLSYQGMAVGMLASNIVADVGQTMQQCSNVWLEGKKDEESTAVCKEAWKAWTGKSMASKYIPQLASMMVSQAITEFLEASGSKAVGAAERMTIRSFLMDGALSKLASRAGFGIKITAADVAITFIPGAGWVSKGMKIVGTVTRIAAFVAVDRIISSLINRPMENALQSTFMKFDSRKMNKTFEKLDAISWSQKNSTSSILWNDLTESVETYSENMRRWQTHLNADTEMDLAGWEEMTTKLLNQMDYAYKFYREFSENTYATLKTSYLVDTKVLEPGALDLISHFPFRTLPFFGVQPKNLKSINNVPLQDYYLMNPRELQQKQGEYIVEIAKKYSNKGDSKFTMEENASIQRIMNNLASGKTTSMVTGLQELNSIFKKVMIEFGLNFTLTYSAMNTIAPGSGILKALVPGSLIPGKDKLNIVPNMYKKFTPEYANYIWRLRNELGNPNPVVRPVEAFAYAMSANSQYGAVEKNADFRKWSIGNTYKFSKPSDLVMFQLICGDQKGSFNETKVKVDSLGMNITIFNPNFMAPALVKSSSEKEAFCKSITTSSDLYSQKIGGKTLKDFLTANLNYQAIGNIRKGDQEGVFDKWWIQNAKIPTNGFFKEYDQKYQEIYKKSHETFLGQRSFYKKVVDKMNNESDVMPNTVNKALRYELNTYLQILNRTLVKDSAKLRYQPESGDKKALKGSIFNFFTKPGQLEYLTLIGEKSSGNKFNTIYNMYAPEVNKLYSLYMEYLKMAESNTINFKAYFDLTKKINEASKDVMVRAGLMKVVQSSGGDIFEDLGALVNEAPAPAAKSYQEVKEAMKNPNMKQKAVLAILKGLRMVDGDLSKQLRMRVSLGKRLELDYKEFANMLGH